MAVVEASRIAGMEKAAASGATPAQLMAWAREGTAESKQRLVKAHLPLAFREAWKAFSRGAKGRAFVDRDTLVSVAFEALVRGVDEYDPSLANPEDSGSPVTGFLHSVIRTWLGRALRSEIRYRVRRADGIPPDMVAPEASVPMVSGFCRPDLECAMDSLTEDQRSLVRTLLFQGRTHAEIAADLGLRHGDTVRKRWNRILAQLEENADV